MKEFFVDYILGNLIVELALFAILLIFWILLKPVFKKEQSLKTRTQKALEAFVGMFIWVGIIVIIASWLSQV